MPNAQGRPIDGDLFAMWMGVLAERFNRELSAPTLRAWHRVLSAALDDREFDAAATICFTRERFWPSPEEFIRLVRPRQAPALDAREVFDRILSGKPVSCYEHSPNGGHYRVSDIERVHGWAAAKAWVACGANARLRVERSEDRLEWVMKDFISAYLDAADVGEREGAALAALPGTAPRYIHQVAQHVVAMLPEMPTGRQKLLKNPKGSQQGSPQGSPRRPAR